MNNLNAPEALEEVITYEDADARRGGLLRNIRNTGGEKLGRILVVPLPVLLPLESNVRLLAQDDVGKTEEGANRVQAGVLLVLVSAEQRVRIPRNSLPDARKR